MAMGVNSINISKWSNVDLLSAKQITDHIFNNAQSKATIDVSNMSKVSKPSQGIDFYSQSTSIDAQRQISIANSGINTTAPSAFAQLSSMAAVSSYDSSKTMDGKIYISTNEQQTDSYQQSINYSSSLEVFKSSNDTKGSNSNPFSSNNQEEQENSSSNEQSLNIIG